MNVGDVLMNDWYIIMNAKDIKKQLYHDVPLQIFSYVSVQHGTIVSADDIKRSLGVSVGAVNQTLRLLHGLDVVSREKKGNVYLYRINPDNVLLRQFKIFENTLSLQELVADLKKYCRDIILFGSCAAGTNAIGSDIDLYVLTEYKEKVSRALHKYEAEMPLKPIIMDPLEQAEHKDKDVVFYAQIMKGINLWSGKPEYEGI
jgi:predicted nucleotidyltransferase